MIEKKYHTGRIELNFGEGLPNGFPLILVHGSGSIWQDWNPVIEFFAGRNHLFAVDLRGFGGSGRASGSYNITTFTDDMADFIKGVVPARPVMIGHSLGAMITIDLAGRYPDLIKAVVLEDPPVSIQDNIDQWEGWRYFKMSLEMIKKKIPRQKIITRFIDEEGFSPPEAERMARNLEVIDPGVFEQILEEQTIKLKQDFSTALRRIQCPCLFISSESSSGSLVRSKDLPMVEKSLKNGQMAFIKDVGHSIHMEAAQAFNQVLGDFLFNLE
jgi:pimeloyl-ACP methyl ester carboxylesterase